MMLLATDIGNSNIVFGLYDNQQEKWIQQWRIPSNPQKPNFEYERELRAFFFEDQISLDAIQYLVLGSVVPDLTQIIQQMLHQLFGRMPLLVNHDVYPKVRLTIQNPYEIGADLVANAVAAFERYHSNCVIVDFGTALTFTSISADGEILGVAIAPGLKTAIYSLFEKTAQLPEVPLKLPDSVLGRSTEHAIQAGILRGYVGLVKEMLTLSKQEIGENTKAIATGGLSSILTPLESEFDEIDLWLTLDGLRLIEEYHRRK